MTRLFVRRSSVFTFMLLILPVLILYFTTVSEGVMPPVCSTFEDGLDGWTCTDNTCSNPGGYLLYNDKPRGPQFIYAAEKFLGDYSPLGLNYLEFDVQVFQVGDINRTVPLWITFLSGDYSASFITVDGVNDNNTPTGWIHVVVPLDFTSPGWIVEENFDKTNVEQIRLPGELVDGNEIIGYDNFCISGNPCDCPDSDGDGVPDAWDQCPGTPTGLCVDNIGCSDNCPAISVICDLTPDSTDVSPGDVLSLNALLRNNTKVEVRVFYNAEVIEQNSGQSVWASTPGPVVLDPLEEVSKHFDPTIPPHFSGEYRYIGHVRNKFGEEVHRCEFDFNVVVRDNLWNIRGNNQDFTECDAAVCGETWVNPWITTPNDGSGIFQGECTDQFPWSQTYTKSAGMVSQLVWVVNPNGNLTVEGSANRQWHAWTWVYVETVKVLAIPSGAGSYSSCPRVFLNGQYVGPFPADLNLISGWNRIDITGYNQNDAFSFDLNCDLAGNVDGMSSRGPE